MSIPQEEADEGSLQRWLHEIGRTETLALVVRATLRAFPLVPEHAASRFTLILAILRISSAAVCSIKYQRRFPKKGVWQACDTIEEITGTVIAPAASAAGAIGSIMLGKDDEPARMAAVAIGNLLYAGSSHTRVMEREFSNAIDHDIHSLDFGMPAQQLILKSLWPNETPLACADLWRKMGEQLRKSSAHWAVWIDWYDRLLVTSGAPVDRSWDEAFVDRRGSVLPWDEGPKAVNETIAARLADRAKKLEGDLPLTVTPPLRDQALEQRPSSHRFDWRDNRIEATAVVEPPFDEILATALAEEILAKARVALHGLVRNHADEVTQRSIERIVELMGNPVAEIPEGLLLSRFNTLAAHARAYLDPANDRERAIRAALDDLTISVQSLVDCYPGIRAINANRIALGMQAEDATLIEIELSRMVAAAKDSGAVSSSALEALESGKDEVVDLSAKIEGETNIASAANYIKVRGEMVAARLSDAVNFASATLQQGAIEVRGLSKDTWHEIRKQLPKAAARGVAKAAEEASGETIAALIKLSPVKNSNFRLD